MLGYGSRLVKITKSVIVVRTTPAPPGSLSHHQNGSHSVNLGAFSVSLAVKDLAASKSFYEQLGFAEVGGVAEQGWLILRSPSCTIGLFQGMFEKNMLTFNPGWDANAQPLSEFTDVRELQRQLKAEGVKFESEADETTTGPASFVATDPDGNPVLVDQHV
jgi:catechol 2,3-dioxygenase-like lactoylglutathione lyase family enzyme